MPRKVRTNEQILAANVDQFSDPQKCWNWHGLLTGRDATTPTITIRRKSISARRYLYAQPVPDDQRLVTACNNPLCVNPKHACLPSGLLETFLSMHEGDTACWDWTRPMNYHGKSVRRSLYELKIGPVSRFCKVLPGCATPQCVNPDHMRTALAPDVTISLDDAREIIALLPPGQRNLTYLLSLLPREIAVQALQGV